MALNSLPELVETVIDMDSGPVWREGGCVLGGHFDVAGGLFGIVLAAEFSPDGVEAVEGVEHVWSAERSVCE